MTSIKNKLIDFFALLIFAFLAFVTIAFLLIAENNVYENHPSRNTCEISEISPDIPVDIKEKCRKLRANAHKD